MFNECEFIVISLIGYLRPSVNQISARGPRFSKGGMHYLLDKSLSTGKSNWFLQEPLLIFVMHVRWIAIYPLDIALSNFQTETCFLVEFEVANGHRMCPTTEG